jgi:hypothetical protein
MLEKVILYSTISTIRSIHSKIECPVCSVKNPVTCFVNRIIGSKCDVCLSDVEFYKNYGCGHTACVKCFDKK